MQPMNACGVRDGQSGDMFALSWCNLAVTDIKFHLYFVSQPLNNFLFQG